MTKILSVNPFADTPNRPLRAIRVLKYEYRFPGDEKDDEYGAKALGLRPNDLEWEKGIWWSRRDLQTEYIPTTYREDLDDFEEVE